MIKDKIIEFIKNYYIKILYFTLFTILIIFTSFVIKSYVIQYKNEKNPFIIQMEDDDGIKANYKNDMGFLECIGEQHSCLYKNLDKGKEIILNNCKEENFCNEVYNNSINVKSK